MHVPIDAIENVLAHAGTTTEFYDDEDLTSFIMESGEQAIELIDAVSDGFFLSDHLTEAILYNGLGFPTDVTSSFENVETLEEFITAVNDTFGTVV